MYLEQGYISGFSSIIRPDENINNNCIVNIFIKTKNYETRSIKMLNQAPSIISKASFSIIKQAAKYKNSNIVLGNDSPIESTDILVKWIYECVESAICVNKRNNNRNNHKPRNNWISNTI